MNKEHKFQYKWFLNNGYPANGIEKHGLKVFGTFICGGGSSMGYKLAGYNHIGGVEIDEEVARVYKLNHSPIHLFRMDIRDFNKLELPNDLYDLDILDGSPPCSSFSMAGAREKCWGEKKKFREGQTVQVLDDLVFIYCETIIKLRPKVFILENVKGIIQGNARVYAKNIVKKMNNAGYEVQVFLLNAATMGVPQKRERVFFIGRKKELKFKNLYLNFKEKPIYFKEVEANCSNSLGNKISGIHYDLWLKTQKGKSLSTAHHKGSFFNSIKISDKDVINTIAASSRGKILHYCFPNELSNEVIKLCGSYPLDYNFNGLETKYIVGMSVPPVMTAQISHQIFLQWFNK